MKRTLLALLVWLCTAAASQAQDIIYLHVVRPGETLASIAQTYYGDPKRETVLVTENGLTDQGGAGIVEGLRLIIPTVRYHRVQTGDTWRDIAKRYYGDESRAAILLRANDAKPGSSPDEGAQLLIPYPVRHIVRQGESIVNIAELYYGSRDEVRTLRAFNNAKGRLTRGHMLLVPLLDLVLSPEGRRRVEEATGARTEGGEARALQAEVDKQLPALRELLSRGRYAEALALGNRLLGTGQLTGNQEISIQRELATAYVALDRPDLAAQAFERALEKQPDLELDSVRTSPRVLSALDQAKRARSSKPAPAAGKP
jgi:LysM repeat protein